MIVKETTVGLGADYVSKILHNTILPFMLEGEGEGAERKFDSLENLCGFSAYQNSVLFNTLKM
jgi:hypothetical protein